MSDKGNGGEIKQGPLRDRNGVLDSDLVLKMGCMAIALIGLAMAVLGAPLGLYGERRPPDIMYLSLAILGALGLAGAFIMKGRLGQGSAPAQDLKIEGIPADTAASLIQLQAAQGMKRGELERPHDDDAPAGVKPRREIREPEDE